MASEISLQFVRPRADDGFVIMGGDEAPGRQPRVGRYLLDFLHAETDAIWMLGPTRVGTSFPILDQAGEASAYLSMTSEGDPGRYEDIGNAVAAAIAAITRVEDQLATPATELARDTTLDEGLSGGRIVSYFQPIVALRTGEVVAIEALARWQTPDGVLGPSAFIDRFNNQQLMLALFDRMLEAALQFLADYKHRMPDLAATVNLELAAITGTGLAELVADRLAEYGIEPELLTIELNERLAYELTPDALDQLRQIAATGVKFLLDDVSASFIALDRLPGLTISGAKLDRRYVNQLTAGDHEMYVVRSILERAAAAGVEVIAEGVETQVQCDRLVRLGCHFGQGYMFAVPQPASSLAAVLEAPLATTW